MKRRLLLALVLILISATALSAQNKGWEDYDGWDWADLEFSEQRQTMTGMILGTMASMVWLKLAGYEEAVQEFPLHLDLTTDGTVYDVCEWYIRTRDFDAPLFAVFFQIQWEKYEALKGAMQPWLQMPNPLRSN